MCKMFIKCILLLFIFSYVDSGCSQTYNAVAQQSDLYKEIESCGDDIEGLPPSSMVQGSCAYPRLEHGRVRIRQRAKLVKFICYARYELVGNKYATCVDGEWDVPLPVCVRPGCTIPKVENGVQMSMRQGAWVVFFCLPGHRLEGSSAIYCDGSKWNATAPTCIATKAPYQMSCNFETPDLCGWTQDELHDFDWRRWNKKTPSSFLFTGPSFDHTYGAHGSGYYMYIESTSRLENDTARLLSPIYDKELSKNGCFSFFYHMYGGATGGLRVYQKPESRAKQSLLQLPDAERKKYLLFEKWGDQGDFWYTSVSKLTNFSENFQIVIEGIRGSSFTSDIAVDDVAILQGDNCTAASNAATTPPTVMSDTCNNRCDVFGVPAGALGCGCTASCVTDRNCCPDFFELCVFSVETTTSDDSPATLISHSSELAPQTQKLVAATTETTSKTTPTTSSTIKITETTITITPKTTARSTRPTTRTQPITKPSMKLPTTVSSTIKTTRAPIRKTTTMKTSVATISTPTPTPTPTTTVKPTTKKISTTTNLPYGISRTLENHNVYHEMIEKVKKKETVEEKKMTPEEVKSSESGSSSVKAIIITLVVLVCCAGAVWLVVAARGERGRATIARLRGRTVNDPEVRYLTTDVDDE